MWKKSQDQENRAMKVIKEKHAALGDMTLHEIQVFSSSSEKVDAFLEYRGKF